MFVTRTASLARSLALGAAICVLGVSTAAGAQTLDLTQRQVPVVGKLDVASATKVASTLIDVDAQAEAPIFLMITATAGTAQGVLIVADTIRSLQSPVVGVVMTQVHGAGAAVATFADQVLMYPAAGLVFNEIPYEGVDKPKKPEPPKALKEGETAKPPEEPKPEEVLLQAAREQFMARFHERLAARIYWKAHTFTSKLEEGGFVMAADEAVRGKVATAVVDRITYTQLREIKKEIKVITTEKKARTAPNTVDD